VKLHVHEWGSGPPAVLVHGSILGARCAFVMQQPLTERWTLIAPDRIGHGDSPPGRSDFEVDARLVAEQLLDRPQQPVHLLGNSYGGIVAMLAAVQRPENVRSLTVVEPPCVAVARGDPGVEAMAAVMEEMRDRAPEDDRELLALFFSRVGVDLEVPDPLPEPLLLGTRAMRTTRQPDEAEIPLAELAASGIPMLVVSGGHSAAFEPICDAIAAGTGARREALTGAGHQVPTLGEPFNELVEGFWLDASAEA
jgi:pimeloyl-ACP methyl ester carboxylesterase